MPLAYKEFFELQTNILEKIKRELDVANRMDELDEYLAKIGFSDVFCKYQTSYIREAKILIFGDSQTNVDILKKEAFSLGNWSESIRIWIGL